MRSCLCSLVCALADVAAADYDMILVMADGKVAEYGPPAELLADEGGVLAAMVAGMGEGTAAKLRARAAAAAER